MFLLVTWFDWKKINDFSYFFNYIYIYGVVVRFNCWELIVNLYRLGVMSYNKNKIYIENYWQEKKFLNLFES